MYIRQKGMRLPDMSGQTVTGTYKSILLYPGLGAATEIKFKKREKNGGWLINEKNKRTFPYDEAEEDSKIMT